MGEKGSTPECIVELFKYAGEKCTEEHKVQSSVSCAPGVFILLNNA